MSFIDLVQFPCKTRTQAVALKYCSNTAYGFKHTGHTFHLWTQDNLTFGLGVQLCSFINFYLPQHILEVIR